MSFNPGGGGGAGNIAGSTDVSLNNVSDDQALAYDQASDKWQNKGVVISGIINEGDPYPAEGLWLVRPSGSGSSLLASFSGENTTANATLTLTATETIPVGAFVVIGTVRSTLTGNTNGVSSIADPAGNTWTVNNAVANRASSTDVGLHSCRITSQIASGSTITITFNSASGARKAAIAGVWSGVTSGTVNAHSGNTYAGTGEVASNAHGNSANPSVSTGATTVADTLVCYAFSGNGGSPGTADGGLTTVGSAATTLGSSDRSVILAYAVASTTGVKTGTATNPASGGWAAAAAAYEVHS